jgi:hypothetical protein
MVKSDQLLLHERWEVQVVNGEGLARQPADFAKYLPMNIPHRGAVIALHRTGDFRDGRRYSRCSSSLSILAR